MPRKPKKCTHGYSLRQRLLTFSQFSRLKAMATQRQRVREDVPKPKLQSKDIPTSSSMISCQVSSFLCLVTVAIFSTAVCLFIDNGLKNNGKDKILESDSSDDEEFKGVVQADFVFFDPKPSDFHGVKILLKSYLDNTQWDLSGFVDLILGQPTVGTVVKIENDEDDGVYSILSALNLGRYKDSPCVVELKDYLLKVCQDHDVIAKLKSLVGEHAKDVGFLVSQRVVNLPPQLLPPLYDGLFDEVEWATEDEPTEELRSSFRFKFYLIICKIYKHKHADANKGTTKKGEEIIIYSKPEDEIFFELSSWSFIFPLHTQQVTAHELKNYRAMGLAMAFEASKISSFRKQLHSLIDE